MPFNLTYSSTSLGSASSFPHFCGNLLFLFSAEISALGFLTSEKKFSKNFFVKTKQNKTKAVPCNNFPQSKWRLNPPAQEEQEKL